MDEEIQPDYQEFSREYPAVRCRDCGTITHICTAGGTFARYICSSCRDAGVPCPHTAKQVQTYDEGLHDGWKLVRTKHSKGCSQPPSRLALLLMLQDQAPELEGSDLEIRLQRYMTEGEVKQAAEELLECLRDR
jgi:hypothetical protein